MNYFIAGLSFLLYTIYVPMSIFLVNLLKEELTRSFSRGRRNKKIDPDKLTYKEKVSKYWTYIKSDKTLKTKFYIIYSSMALFVTAIGYFSINYPFLFILLFFLIPSKFALNSIMFKACDNVIQERDKILNRMLDLKFSRMGKATKTGLLPDELEVLEWEESIKPTKVRMTIPVNFEPLAVDVFLLQWNVMFGDGREWAPDVTGDEKGWDFISGFVTLKAGEPMPNMAPWSAHYVLNEKCPWSYFPLAIGVQGGILMDSPDGKSKEHILGFDFAGNAPKEGKKKGYYVGDELQSGASPMCLVVGATGGGKSVLQQNILTACLLRPKHWIPLGIDLKRVELSRYRAYGMNVATELEDALEYLRFAQATMMARYAEMEKTGHNNFLDLQDAGQALLVMVDEAGELLGAEGGSSEETKERNAMKDDCRTLIGSIARLGRAAGVHLVIATQRPDAKIIEGETKANLTTRIGCGPLSSSASSMAFESSIGRRIRKSPKGGVHIQVHGAGNMGQGFFAPNEWLDEYMEPFGGYKEWLKTQGLGKEVALTLELTEREQKGDPLEDWDEAMDAIYEAAGK